MKFSYLLILSLAVGMFISCNISSTNKPIAVQNADKILLKNYRPASLYNIPVTKVDRAAFPVIDIVVVVNDKSKVSAAMKMLHNG